MSKGREAPIRETVSERRYREHMGFLHAEAQAGSHGLALHRSAIEDVEVALDSAEALLRAWAARRPGYRIRLADILRVARAITARERELRSGGLHGQG